MPDLPVGDQKMLLNYCTVLSSLLSGFIAKKTARPILMQLVAV
jgi:hypothetical protein